jgi:hypothetical protein
MDTPNAVQEGTVETTEESSPAAIADTTEALETQAAEAAEGSEEAPAKAEEAPKPTEQDRKFAAKFAALSRKERAVTSKVKAAEQRLAEIEARIASSAAPVEKKQEVVQEDFETRLLKDPFNTLKAKGLDFETLTKMALNDGKLTPELQMQIMQQEMEKKIAAQFEEKYGKKLSEYEARIKAEDEQKKAAVEAKAVNDFKSGIKSDLESEKDNFELLLAEGQDGIDLVYNVMDAHYQETGRVMGKKEAAKLVEAELLSELEKRTGLSKVQKLLAAKVQTPKAKESKPASPTLTNAMSQASSTGKRRLSDEESRQEAAKLIKWSED